MNDDEICVICKIKFKDKDYCINCTGVCSKKFHLKCVNLTLKEYQLVQGQKGIKWFCEHCLSVVTKILNINTDIENFKRQVTNELIEIRHMLNSPTKYGKDNNKAENKTYANVAASEVVIIKPKNKQESQKTREEIQKNLKPSTLEVGINQIRNIKEGGVLIKCKNKEEQNKIKKAAEKELTKLYQVKAPELKNPLIKIVDIEEKLTNEELVNSIKRQNKSIISETMEIDVKVNKKMKQTFMAILEVDPITFQKIMQEHSLSIGWKKCRVFEYIPVFRCFNCGGYNHHSKDCNIKRCLKCTSEEHETKDCMNQDKCYNCIEANRKLNLDLIVTHSIYDKDCPVFLKRVAAQKQKIKNVGNVSKSQSNGFLG